MKRLLNAFRRGPVAQAALVIIEERIHRAEAAFAEEVAVIEKDVEDAIVALETKLEEDTELVLKKHVGQIFSLAS